MHSCYSLVTRASSREKVDLSESLRCFVSYPFSLRAGFISSDARVFGNTSQLFCYRIRREAQLALKTRSKSQREMLHYDHLTPSCNNCTFLVWFEICLYVLNFLCQLLFRGRSSEAAASLKPGQIWHIPGLYELLVYTDIANVLDFHFNV